MVVITLSVCPAKLRGDLSKWVQEIDEGVFVGRLSARVRDELWKRIETGLEPNSRALMIYSHNNVQGYLIKTIGTKWTPIDVDGLVFMQRPLTPTEEQRILGSYKPKRNSIEITQQVTKHVSTTHSSARKINVDKKTKCLLKYIDEGYSRFADWYVVVDIETSGLDVETCDVIEIAAIEVKNGCIEDTFEALIKIEKPLPELIVEMTGITDEMLRTGGIDAHEAMNSLIGFIGDRPIVSYCSHFDFKFLYALCEKCSLPKFSVEVMDAWRMAKASELSVENYKLSTLAAYFGIDYSHAHRAMPDCVITMQIFDKLNKNIYSHM